MKHHYVYRSYEPLGRGYIGSRTCNCLPEEDTKYYGSFRDKTFSPTQKEILAVCDTREEALRMEVFLHDMYDVARNPMFANRAKQTSTSFCNEGVPHSEETKYKISEAHAGIKPNELSRQKMREAQLGRTRSKETRRKIGEAKAGEKHPMYGTSHSEEAKYKMRDAKIGRSWWVNPKGEIKMQVECPGPEWRRGMRWKEG